MISRVIAYGRELLSNSSSEEHGKRQRSHITGVDVTVSMSVVLAITGRAGSSALSRCFKQD